MKTAALCRCEPPLPQGTTCAKCGKPLHAPIVYREPDYQTRAERLKHVRPTVEQRRERAIGRKRAERRRKTPVPPCISESGVFERHRFNGGESCIRCGLALVAA